MKKKNYKLRVKNKIAWKLYKEAESFLAFWKFDVRLTVSLLVFCISGMLICLVPLYLQGLPSYSAFVVGIIFTLISGFLFAVVVIQFLRKRRYSKLFEEMQNV